MFSIETPLPSISIKEIEENLVENFENESSDFVNLSDSGHSRNSEYLDSDFDPENSSEDSETEETQDSDTGNKLIMSSLENLNKIITDFAPSCPKCSCKDLFFEPSIQDGINNFLVMKCRKCERNKGGWSLPPSANFAFVVNTLSNGIKFSSLEK